MISVFTRCRRFLVDSCLRFAKGSVRSSAIVAVILSILWTGSLAVSAEAQARSLGQVLPAETVMSDTGTVSSPAPVLFEQNCAGCHVNGGNVIRRGKNLKKKAMARNGYGDVDAIAQIITNGKGIMSAYGDRLNSEEISAIAGYVHEQSESGW